MSEQPDSQRMNIELAEDYWQHLPAQPRPASTGETIELTITYDPHPDRRAWRRYKAMVNAAIRALRKGGK